MEILITFIIVSVSIFILQKRLSYKRKEASLVITAANKDRKISLISYSEQIDDYFSTLTYSITKEKNIRIFEPLALTAHFFDQNKSTLIEDPLYLELRGPHHIIKVLAKVLETDSSSLLKSVKNL